MQYDVNTSWQLATSALRSALEDLIEQRQSRRQGHGYVSSASSRAMAELEASKRLQAYVGTPTEDAVHFADQFLLAAEDHFGALCRLVVHDAPVLFADKVLARAGIEACARAVWILDPALDAQRRAFWGLTQRFATMKANEDLLKGAAEERQFCKDRRNELISQCRSGGLPVTRRDGTAFVGEPLPTERSAMRNLFGYTPGDEVDLGSLSQTWLSRFVHSDPAGLMENMLETLPSEIEAPTIPGALTRGLAASSDGANQVMGLCSLALLRADVIFLRHQGWDDADWSRTILNVRGHVRASLRAVSAASSERRQPGSL
jgi:hypothetical protein